MVIVRKRAERQSACSEPPLNSSSSIFRESKLIKRVMAEPMEESPVKDSGQKPAGAFIDLTLGDSSDEDFLDLTVNDCEDGLPKVGETIAPSASFVLGQETEVCAVGQELEAADDSGYSWKPDDTEVLVSASTSTSTSARLSITPDFEMEGEGATRSSFWSRSGNSNDVIDRQSGSALISSREDQIYGKELLTMGQARSTLPLSLPPNASNASQADIEGTWPPLNSSGASMTNNMVCTAMGSTATNTNNPLLDTGRVYPETQALPQMSGGVPSTNHSTNVATVGKVSAANLQTSSSTVSGSQSCVDLTIVKQEPMDDLYMYQSALASRSDTAVYGPNNYCMPGVKHNALPNMYGLDPVFAGVIVAALRNSARWVMSSGLGSHNTNASLCDQQDMDKSHRTMNVDNSVINTLSGSNRFNIYEAECSLNRGAAIDNIQETGSGLASVISSAMHGSTSTINSQTGGTSGSIVWPLAGTQTPLSVCYENTPSHVLINDYHFYVRREKEGFFHNVEPSMLAAVSMWERKVLREMNLVDSQRVVIAEDEKGLPIYMDQKYDLIQGLAFVRLPALTSEGLWESTSQVTMPALMNGTFGPIRYKCDYCDYSTDGDLKSHLMKRQHPSGSIILQLKKKGSKAGLTCIVLPSLIKISAPFRKVYPVCPVCWAVFEDLMDCVGHTFKHGGITGVYQLRQVSHTRTFIVTTGIMTCSVCSSAFPTFRGLVDHWKMTKHVNLDGESQGITFFCCQTSRDCSFRSANFELVHQHVFTQHRTQNQGIVKGIYLDKPAPVKRLMLFFPMNCVNVKAEAAADKLQPEKQSISNSDHAGAAQDGRVQNSSSVTASEQTSDEKFCTSQQLSIDMRNSSCSTSPWMLSSSENQTLPVDSATTASKLSNNSLQQKPGNSSKSNVSCSTENKSDGVAQVKLSHSCQTVGIDKGGPNCGIQMETFMRGQKRTATEREENCSAEDNTSSSEIPKAAGSSPLKERNQQDQGFQMATCSSKGYARNCTVQDSRLEFREGLAFVRLSTLTGNADPLAHHLVNINQLTQGSEFGLMRFMCDYCRSVFVLRRSLIRHLKKKMHSTGSIVLWQTAGSKNAELASYFILAPACFKFRSNCLHHLVPVCPHCQEMFGDLMDCVAHSYQHGGPTGTYQFHQVSRVQGFPAVKGVPVECNLCRHKMSCLETLIEHWKLTHHRKILTTSHIGYRCARSKHCTFVNRDLEQVLKHMLDHEGQRKKPLKVMLVSEKPCTRAKCLLPIFPITLLSVYPNLVARLASSKNSAASGPDHQLGKTGQYRLLEELGKIMVDHLTREELTAAGKPASRPLSKIQKLSKSQPPSGERAEANHTKTSKKQKLS